MREVFPTPQRRDPVSAGFLAKVSRSLRTLTSSRHGVHGCGAEGAESGLPPHIQWIVEILYVVNATLGQYYVKRRYYTGTGGPEGWLTDADDNLYELDIGGTVADNAAPETLAVGDRLMAWWHGQRGMFVADPATKPLIRFELTETLELGDEADAEIVTWDGAAYAKNGVEIVVKDFTANPGSWQGVSGYQGWCLLPKDNDDGKYEIVWMEMVARYIEFTLDENMQEDEDNEGIGWHAIATVNRYWHIKNPGNKVVVSDVQELFTRARKYARGIAIWDERRKLYIIVECESKAGHLQIELANPIAAKKSDGAFVYDWRGTQQDIQIPGANVTVRDEDDLFSRALTGARGLAVYDADDDRYHLFQCQSKAGWIRGTLAQSMSSSTSSAPANIAEYGGTQQDIQAPPAGTMVFDPSGLFKRALKEAKFKAIYNAKTDQYILVECQTKAGFITFTLTTDWAYNSATAGSIGYYGSQQDVQNPLIDGATTVIVYDSQGLFAYARAGAKGLARYDSEEDKYHIVNCEQLCTHLFGSLVSAMVSSDVSASVDSLSGVGHDPFSQLPTDTTITADNPFGFEGDAGAVVLLLRDQAGWKIIQVECPA